MKKIFVILLSALLCTSAAGCDITDEASSVAEKVQSAVADADEEKNENADSEEKKENEVKENSEADSESNEESEETGAEETTEEKPQEETLAEQEADKQQEQSVSDESEEDDVDPMKLAEMYYNDACTMYHTVLLTCPYVLDYDNITDDGWAPVNDPNCTEGIKSIEDYYCNLFTQPDEYIYERYKEIDGKLYCNDAARGTDIFYAGTTFELVDESDEGFTFNAISHYEFEETGEKFDDETAVFSIVKWEDGYKVSEFTFPM